MEIINATQSQLLVWISEYKIITNSDGTYDLKRFSTSDVVLIPKNSIGINIKNTNSMILIITYDITTKYYNLYPLLYIPDTISSVTVKLINSQVDVYYYKIQSDNDYNVGYLQNDINSYILTGCTFSQRCGDGYFTLKNPVKYDPNCICVDNSILDIFKDNIVLPTTSNNSNNTMIIIIVALIIIFIIVVIVIIIIIVVLSKKNKDIEQK
jgi:hypothetical protein